MDEQLNLSAALGHDVRKRVEPTNDGVDEELKLLLRETLERNRAFVAGAAFGVPAEAMVQYVDAIVDDLVRVFKPLLETSAVTPKAAGNALMEASSDGGLEYARLYGVYPDGRPYSSEKNV